MGNYADNKAATDEIKAREAAQLKAQQAQQVQQAAAAPAAVDPYGTSGISNQSVRRRGSTDQQRVGQDTRVRDDASSGTAGAQGSGIGAAMQQSAAPAPAAPAQPSITTDNAMWQGSRQPTDLASIQQRVLQSLNSFGQKAQ